MKERLKYALNEEQTYINGAVLLTEKKDYHYKEKQRKTPTKYSTNNYYNNDAHELLQCFALLKSGNLPN